MRNPVHRSPLLPFSNALADFDLMLGTSVREETRIMYCSKCGKATQDGSVFCPGCGTGLTSETRVGELGHPKTTPRRARRTGRAVAGLLLRVTAVATAIVVAAGSVKAEGWSHESRVIEQAPGGFTPEDEERADSIYRAKYGKEPSRITGLSNQHIQKVCIGPRHTTVVSVSIPRTRSERVTITGEVNGCEGMRLTLVGHGINTSCMVRGGQFTFEGVSAGTYNLHVTSDDDFEVSPKALDFVGDEVIKYVNKTRVLDAKSTLSARKLDLYLGGQVTLTLPPEFTGTYIDWLGGEIDRNGASLVLADGQGEYRFDIRDGEIGSSIRSGDFSVVAVTRSGTMRLHDKLSVDGSSDRGLNLNIPDRSSRVRFQCSKQLVTYHLIPLDDGDLQIGSTDELDRLSVRGNSYTYGGLTNPVELRPGRYFLECLSEEEIIHNARYEYCRADTVCFVLPGSEQTICIGNLSDPMRINPSEFRRSDEEAQVPDHDWYFSLLAEIRAKLRKDMTVFTDEHTFSQGHISHGKSETCERTFNLDGRSVYIRFYLPVYMDDDPKAANPDLEVTFRVDDNELRRHYPARQALVGYSKEGEWVTKIENQGFTLSFGGFYGSNHGYGTTKLYACGGLNYRLTNSECTPVVLTVEGGHLRLLK
jgi:hypothetical protein